MKWFLRLKCKSCGHWNRIEVNKVFIEQPYPKKEPRVKALIPMYEPLKRLKRVRNAEKLIAQPKELQHKKKFLSVFDDAEWGGMLF